MTTPKGLRRGGKALWGSVTDALELDSHEQVVLLEACRVRDRLGELDAAIRSEGVLVGGKVHPALIEARQQQITLARLLAALRLPEDLQSPQKRPQRRQIRGMYSIQRHREAS